MADGFKLVSLFLSDQFDNFFKSYASPIKVAFTAGLGIGLVLGYSGRNIRYRATGFASGVKGRLPWKAVSLQLDGDFNEAMEAMLDRVSPFFAKDNNLHSGLKTLMKPEIEVGDFRSLMVAVAPRLMQDYNNNQLSVANFFSRVIEFLKSSGKVKDELDEQANGLTRHCFQADILLIYGNDDSELAAVIKAYIEESGISAELHADVGIGKPIISRLSDVFKKYIYVFIIKENLKEDVLAKFISEMNLVESLFNAEGRLIPVQTTDEKNPVYDTIAPWKFNAEGSRKQLEDLIKNASKTLFQ